MTGVIKRQRKKRTKKSTCIIYELKVELLYGRITEEFAEKNPEISRTIAIRGDQTLEDLHWAIFDAFDRFEEHLYEFYFGNKRSRKSIIHRYTAPECIDDWSFDNSRYHDATVTKIGMVGTEMKKPFYYTFDFGDCWEHKITLVEINKVESKKKDYPMVIQQVGESPAQYPDSDDWDDEDWDDDVCESDDGSDDE